jgi:hypothetical protein
MCKRGSRQAGRSVRREVDKNPGTVQLEGVPSARSVRTYHLHFGEYPPKMSYPGAIIGHAVSNGSSGGEIVERNCASGWALSDEAVGKPGLR